MELKDGHKYIDRRGAVHTVYRRIGIISSHPFENETKTLKWARSGRYAHSEDHPNDLVGEAS